MSTTDDARAEAERRYAGRGEVSLSPGAIRNARREAFERGAEWQASRKVEITDELVEKGARDQFEHYRAQRPTDHGPYAGWDDLDSDYRAYLLAGARAALGGEQ
jgi:hypothetical protein